MTLIGELIQKTTKHWLAVFEDKPDQGYYRGKKILQQVYYVQLVQDRVAASLYHEAHQAYQRFAGYFGQGGMSAILWQSVQGFSCDHDGPLQGNRTPAQGRTPPRAHGAGSQFGQQADANDTGRLSDQAVLQPVDVRCFSLFQ